MWLFQNKMKKTRDPFEVLPKDLAIEILSFLSSEELAKNAKINRKWKELCNQDKLWKDLCRKENPSIMKEDEMPWKFFYIDHFGISFNVMLSVSKKGRCVKIGKDFRTAKFENISAVFGTKPIPQKRACYWEIQIVDPSTTYVGICDSKKFDPDYNRLDNDIGSAGAIVYRATASSKWMQGVPSRYGSGASTGDILGILVDMRKGEITFYKNGKSEGLAFNGLTGEYYPILGGHYGELTIVRNPKFPGHTLSSKKE